MRDQFGKISVKGVATMKFYVAGLLVLALSAGMITEGQSPSRAGNKPDSKPRGETIKICQGVPVPDGYVIVAYMTSSACPHGAYILKKQSQYENSLAINGDAQPANAAKEAASKTKPITSAARTSSSQIGRTATPSTTSSNDQLSAGTSPASSATRPRRVGVSPNQPATQTQPPVQPQQIAQNQDEAITRPAGPPTLIGSAPATPLRPPTLTNAGSQTQPSIPEDSTTSGAVAQPTPEEVDENDVVRVDTALVTVPVSAVDRQGRFVPNLKKEDFKLTENGVEQPIAYFEPAEKPFTVALLLDTSASTHFHLSEIREAAIEFAKQLRPQDRVLVVSFNDEVLLLTEATNDLNLIESVIEVNANTGSSTRLYDAVDLTIRERLDAIKGRKAIVLFTDGVDTSSQQASYQSTLREVEELDALIYPIQYDTTDYSRAMQASVPVTVVTTQRGIFGTRTSQQTYNVPVNGGVPLPGTSKADYDRADQYLHGLADKTGGRLYQANDTAQLADAFKRIAEELRRQYTLGYYSKNSDAADGDRRQIRVRVNQPNVAVKARDSYVKSSAPKSAK